jgi:hypothetical protein
MSLGLKKAMKYHFENKFSNKHYTPSDVFMREG